MDYCDEDIPYDEKWAEANNCLPKGHFVSKTRCYTDTVKLPEVGGCIGTEEKAVPVLCNIDDPPPPRTLADFYFSEPYLKSVRRRASYEIEQDERLQPKAAHLLAICRVMQEDFGDDGCFYLSCRDAAEMMGCSHMTAARYLKILCRMGILRLVRKGVRAEKPFVRKLNEETGEITKYRPAAVYKVRERERRP